MHMEFKHKYTEFFRSEGVGTALVLIGAFYLYVIAAMLVNFVLPFSPAALPLSTVYAEHAVRQIVLAQEGSRRLPDWWASTIKTLHKGNAGVLRELAIYDEKSLQYEKASALVRRTLALEPKNIINYKLYQDIQQKMGSPVELVAQTMLLSEGFLPGGLYEKAKQGVGVHPPNPYTVLGEKVLDLRRTPAPSVVETLARMYYVFGLSLRDINPQGTLYWWGLASQVDPGVSYYAVELADFLYERQQRVSEAKQVLRVCENNAFAQKHCTIALTEMNRGMVADPGFYQELILKDLPLISP